MTAMSLASLRNDGLIAALGLLVLLLAMSLLTIIRQPRWLPGAPEDDGAADPGRPDPAPLRSTPPAAAEAALPSRAAAAAPVAASAAKTGEARYPARHVRYPEPGYGPGPRVSGGPPWGPAPRPPA
ncbi:MAG: hypothetical protein ACLP70_21315 [Streptosporangiaceae bacterium]|jgi:hypothetical protein